MQKIIVIKIGGVASDNLTVEFYQQLEKWKNTGKKIVIVHGGGHYISRMMEKLGLPITVKDGLRLTTHSTLEVTKMVLLGQVQPTITADFQKHNIATIGLNASHSSLLQGDYLNKEKFGLVGKLNQVNKTLIYDCLLQGYIPVIAPLAMTDAGEWLNVNADDAACQIAKQLQAEALYLVTDVPGVKKQNTWLKELCCNDIQSLKDEKVIAGGMIPKLESASFAAQSGVAAVHITNGIQNKGTVIKSLEVSV